MLGCSSVVEYRFPSSMDKALGLIPCITKEGSKEGRVNWTKIKVGKKGHYEKVIV